MKKYRRNGETIKYQQRNSSPCKKKANEKKSCKLKPELCTCVHAIHVGYVGGSGIIDMCEVGASASAVEKILGFTFYFFLEWYCNGNAMLLP